jgi:hypothetical protein
MRAPPNAVPREATPQPVREPATASAAAYPATLKIDTELAEKLSASLAAIARSQHFEDHSLRPE